MTNMKPRNECSYYLVREMGGLGAKAKDVFFDDMLEHIRQNGLKDMRHIEVEALVMAARERGRLDELDAAVRCARSGGDATCHGARSRNGRISGTGPKA